MTSVLRGVGQEADNNWNVPAKICVGRWSFFVGCQSVLFPLATNEHWFSMPVGPLPLAAVGLADQRPKQVLAGSFQLLSGCR